MLQKTSFKCNKDENHKKLFVKKLNLIPKRWIKKKFSARANLTENKELIAAAAAKFTCKQKFKKTIFIWKQ